jgi:RNA polymerase sigma-70 factor (ECF subfamily)
MKNRADGDDTLITAVANGDREALAELYRRHAPWLLLRLSRRCADPGTVEEVVQDTFVAVWRGAKRFRGTGEGPAPFPWARADDTMVSAEDEVLVGVEHGDLGAAVGRLSPELRAVIQATVLDGLTTKEAATLLGIPQGTVKTRAARARRELREALA